MGIVYSFLNAIKWTIIVSAVFFILAGSTTVIPIGFFTILGFVWLFMVFLGEDLLLRY